VLHDVAEQLLALAASPKRDASENVLKLLKNPFSDTDRNRFENRIMMSGHVAP
jgi:hypothetical protein